MPADVLEVTKKFMRDPIRILVKKEELTLEGIKQFYINVEREVSRVLYSDCCSEMFLFFKVSQSVNAFPSKNPAKTAAARPLRFSSCGGVSMGASGKEIKSTVSEMRLGRTSFLMSNDHCLKVRCYKSFCLTSSCSWNKPLLYVANVGSIFYPVPLGVEARHPVWSVWNFDNHPGCHLPQHQEKSWLVDREDAC